MGVFCVLFGLGLGAVLGLEAWGLGYVIALVKIVANFVINIKKQFILFIIIFVDRAAAVAVAAVDVVAQQVDLFAFVAPVFYVFVPGKIDR